MNWGLNIYNVLENSYLPMILINTPLGQVKNVAYTAKLYKPYLTNTSHAENNSKNPNSHGEYQTQNPLNVVWGGYPFKKSAIKYGKGFIQYGKNTFKLWDSYNLSQFDIHTGSFVQDSRGRWYVCVTVDTPKQLPNQATKAIGIDLGLKDLADFCTIRAGSKVF